MPTSTSTSTTTSTSTIPTTTTTRLLTSTSTTLTSTSTSITSTSTSTIIPTTGKVQVTFQINISSHNTITYIYTIHIYILVQASWGAWSSWGHCSKSCTLGVQRRTRTCRTSVAKVGTGPCEVDGSQKFDARGCNQHACKY